MVCVVWCHHSYFCCCLWLSAVLGFIVLLDKAGCQGCRLETLGHYLFDHRTTARQQYNNMDGRGRITRDRHFIWVRSSLRWSKGSSANRLHWPNICSRTMSLCPGLEWPHGQGETPTSRLCPACCGGNTETDYDAIESICY